MESVEKRKNLMMLAIITIIIIYIAVSVFWIIRDFEGGETVFVISSEIPQVGITTQESILWTKIKEFIKVPEPEKIVVPIERELTIKGRVVYINNNPFSNGLVELRSEPRRTYTDKEGYFTFENVEYGEHTIIVLDKNTGQILSSAKVVINCNLEIKNTRLLQLGDGTWVMEVSVDIKTLEIVLEIEQDANGNPTGNLAIHLKDQAPNFSHPDKDPEGDKEKPGDPDKDKPIDPDTPIVDETVPPVDKPDSPDEEDQGGTTEPEASAGELTVYSNDVKKGTFSKNSAQAAKINIFGNNKSIAPGMNGEYKFTVDNTANNFSIYYDINLIETDNELNIPMKYRLKNNKTNKYVTQNNKKWQTIDDIIAITANAKNPLDLGSSEKTDYTLEWLWEEGSSDNTYGENHGGKVACTLTIKITAQRK